ncbi:hypothetical protein H6A60_10900, partial [Sutterella massiliensis]
MVVTSDLIVNGTNSNTAQFAIANGVDNSFTITNGANVEFNGSDNAGKSYATAVYAVAVNGGQGNLIIDKGKLSIRGGLGNK